jgi:hypothetical protein
VTFLADSDKPSRNPKFQVRAVPYKNWSYVGCTDLSSPALTHPVLIELLSRVSEGLDFIQAHSHIDAPWERNRWINETVRGVCNRQLNGQCSVEDLDGKLKGAECKMWLDMNDLKTDRTIYHVDPSPSTEAESKRGDLSSSNTAKKEINEITVSKIDYSKGLSASKQYQQLKAKVKDTITCLSRRESKKWLDYTPAHMKEIERVASVWPVIQNFYPKLVSEEEWEKLKTLEKKVIAW